jgi:uncharacterized Fe-S cluster-containing protein
MKKCKNAKCRNMATGTFCGVCRDKRNQAVARHRAKHRFEMKVLGEGHPALQFVLSLDKYQPMGDS